MLDYNRNSQEWDLTFKDNGTVTDTHKIYVWKVTSTAAYFRIVTDETPAKHIYLKVSTTSNTAVMRSVQEDDCAQQLYEGSASSSTVILKKDDPTYIFNDADSQYKYFRTYSFVSSQPAIFGNLKYTEKKQIYDNDEKPTTATTDTYEITADTTPTTQPSNNYADNDYYGASSALRYYCLHTWDPLTTVTYQRYKINPIDIKDVTGNLTCMTGSDTADVVVGTETFDPDGELGAPF